MALGSGQGEKTAFWFRLFQFDMRQKARLLLLQRDVALLHRLSESSARLVFALLGLEEGAEFCVGPAWWQEFFVFVRQRLFIVQLGMRELRATEHVFSTYF